MRGSCISCHGAGAPNVGQYNMSTYAGVMAKVSSGNAALSRLILRLESVVNTAGQSVMPPSPNARVLQSEIDKVKAWINAGALND